MSLIALGLQCLWDEQQLGDDSAVRGELQDAADRYPGSWLKYLVDDTLANGDRVQGRQPEVPPPRLQRRPEEGRVACGADRPDDEQEGSTRSGT